MVGKALQLPTMKTSAQRPERSELKEQKGGDPHATTKTQGSQINQNKHKKKTKKKKKKNRIGGVAGGKKDSSQVEKNMGVQGCMLGSSFPP